ILLTSWIAGCTEHAGEPGPGEVGSAGAPSVSECCPANFDLYPCNKREGGTGLACHNPAMGCPSSETCGGGCDPVVSGRCECIQNVLCIKSSHFDRALCKCVPDDATPTCVQNVLCIRGSHFDQTQCKCVPDDATPTCVQNVLCIRGSHFDQTQCKCVPDEAGDAGVAACNTAADCKGLLPSICEQCPNGNTACAHFACTAGACSVAICD
ncbi:MAG TPA: hypothetical protein VKP30_08425, partial [Polyangiaceae bacterium]|nr:hypothetical protein [Polyangiaceae bacterium]